jgi:hypothetical protein
MRPAARILDIIVISFNDYGSDNIRLVKDYEIVQVIDDLLPQYNWPDGHEGKVTALIADLENRPGFTPTKLAWASRLMIVRSGS